MATRYERGLAAKLKLGRRMYAVAFHWRQEDKLRRAGRHSWRDPRTVKADTSWASAIVGWI